MVQVRAGRDNPQTRDRKVISISAMQSEERVQWEVWVIRASTELPARRLEAAP